MSKLLVVGICGKAGVGKDTLAKMIRDAIDKKYKKYYVKIAHFADPLKQVAAAAFEIPLEFFYDEQMKELKHPYWGVSPREIMQFLGTEVFREQMNKLIPGIEDNFWVRRMEKTCIGELIDVLIIPDVRFQNEVDFITGRGGFLIQIGRPGTKEVGRANHKSEQLSYLKMPTSRYKYVYNSGTLGELHVTADKAAKAIEDELKNG